MTTDRLDIYWHSCNMGLGVHRTKYAYYISLWRLIINVRRT